MEYVQSLISIQTAYINTNHPGFRAGTAEYARQRSLQAANASRNKGALEARKLGNDGHIEDMPETGSSDQDDGSEQGGYPTLGNGRPANAASSRAGPKDRNPKARAGSTSMHDRQASVSQAPINASTANNALYGAGAQSSQHGGASAGHTSRAASQHLHPNAGYHSASQSMSTSGPKDSFLNYFFGGAGGSPGGSMVVDTGLQTGRGTRSSLPDLSAAHNSAGNPLAGRKGHEGAAAAYDMKSLDRHLDADALPLSGPSGHQAGSSANGTYIGAQDQDEMAIDLIQSLISTYFSITRQTIQDLVPKAVMHLLINHSRESVQNRLVASLYKENLFDDLLYEDEGLTSERQRVKALLDSYKEGFRVSCLVGLHCRRNQLIRRTFPTSGSQ